MSVQSVSTLGVVHSSAVSNRCWRASTVIPGTVHRRVVAFANNVTVGKVAFASAVSPTVRLRARRVTLEPQPGAMISSRVSLTLYVCVCECVSVSV